MFIPLHDENPLEVIPFQAVTITLIVACVAVHVATVAGGAPGYVHAAYGVTPSVLLDKATLPAFVERIPAELTLLSAMFVHAGWMHLGGNMLYLWVFGDNVEDELGHLRFAAFYLVCGVVAALAHVAISPENDAPLVGASGAVAGVLGAYLVLHPRAKVLVIAFKRIPLRLPAQWLLAAWIVAQLIGALTTDGTRIAWWAHVAGFAVGAALGLLLKRRPS